MNDSCLEQKTVTEIINLMDRVSTGGVCDVAMKCGTRL